MSTEPFAFAPAIVTAVLHHMNDDHADDNLLFARAFGDGTAVSARMVGVDGNGGDWVYVVEGGEGTGERVPAEQLPAEHPLRLNWRSSITERAQIRQEIVALYDRACAALGVPPRPHD